MRRLISSALAAFHGGNAAFMLFDPNGWLSFVVGRTIEGPLPGAHFIADVGWAFLASAIGFAVFALKPQQWGAAAAGAAFPLLHAFMHVYELAQGEAPRVLFQVGFILAPAFVGAIVAWPGKTLR